MENFKLDVTFNNEEDYVILGKVFRSMSEDEMALFDYLMGLDVSELSIEELAESFGLTTLGMQNAVAGLVDKGIVYVHYKQYSDDGEIVIDDTIDYMFIVDGWMYICVANYLYKQNNKDMVIN